ncbi:MAG: DUF4387 domain-containing protein [Chloroflexi bacterium]|nr:DUF4387 domain-containing protein [Chloroflexota bacterium]
MAEKMVKLGDIATFVTSKNAGPFRLTLDVVFSSGETYRRVKASQAITRRAMAHLYGIGEEDVLEIIHFDAAWAIKVTLERPIGSGAVGETDVYGAQQHVPLMEYLLPWDEE